MCRLLAASSGTSDPLVAAGGKVTYTMTLTTGEKALPNNGNMLVLSFDRAGVTVVGNKCDNPLNNDEYPVGVNLNKLVAGKTALTCRFQVQANTSDQDAASIAPFDVTATFSGPDTTHYEYHVPSTRTPTVLVYAGGRLHSPSSEVVNANGNSMETHDGTWYTGEHMQHKDLGQMVGLTRPKGATQGLKACYCCLMALKKIQSPISSHRANVRVFMNDHLINC